MIKQQEVQLSHREGEKREKDRRQEALFSPLFKKKKKKKSKFTFMFFFCFFASRVCD